MGITIPQVVTSDRASGAQVIDGSLKFVSGSSDHLNRTPSSDGNRRIFTWSGWIKRNSTGAYQVFFGSYSGSDDFHHVRFTNSEALETRLQVSNTDELRLVTNQVFRDLSSGWYHIVFAFDSTKSTNSDKAKLYVNGSQITSFSTETYPSGDPRSFFSSTTTQSIGRRGDDNFYHDGSMSQVYLIDGQALGPESFGYTDGLTNTWRPKKYKFLKNPNNGTTWSSMCSGTVLSGYPYNRAFDSKTSTACYPANGNTITFTPTGGIKNSGNILVTFNNGSASDGGGSADVQINGSSVKSFFQTAITADGGGNGTKRVATITGITNITSMSWSRTDSTDFFAVGRIQVDGYVLLDGAVDNSFYLPMDGNSPIGEDKSGQGNNWTPVNFGGSVALDKATGAKPILNTDGGGNVARPGVFGSEQNVGYAVTVYDDGGGNKYYIDGTKQATLNGLIRGSTYTFDTSDSTLGSTHPFRLSATSAHGTEYTDGVVAITGAATTITVPHNAPNSLYYYCTAHSGMGSSITGITTNEKLADPYAWKNTLALPLVGANSDVSNQINSGSTTKTITNNGVNISNANSNFYGGSHYWDGGTTDRLTVTYNSEFQFGTGDFCVEFWVNLSTSSGNQYFFDFDQNGGVFQYNGDVLSYSDGYVAGSGPLYSTGITLPTDKWVHLAITRESGTGRIFVDGTMRATGTTTYNYNQTSVLDIGNGYNNSGYEITGYMQDFRIYKGVAKYTSSFVVPATSPDILPDTPSGVSGGSKLAKVTDGAVSFDGTGDYLNLASSSDFAFGTGDFTVECLVYNDGHSATGNVVDCRTGSSQGWGLQLSISEYFMFYSEVSASSVLGNMGPVVENKWTHLAVTRSSGTLYGFIDGVLQNSASHTSNYSTNLPCIIGARFSEDQQYFNGFMSNVRVLKGTALYTANFTPPTRELTNVTNTKLLCCQSNTLAGSAAVTPVTGNTGYTGTSQSITLNQANLNAGTVANVVDGSTSTSADIRDAGSFVELIFPQQQNGELQVNVSNGNDVGDDNIRVFIDGVEGTAFDVSSQSWHTIHTGNFTTVKLEQQGSTTGNIFGFRIGTGGDTIISKSVAPVGNAAATNFNPFTTDINAVRGQESGYATLSPLDSGHSGASITFSDGNLKAAFPSTSGTGQAPATIYVSSGKWYCEYYLESVSDLTSVQYGIVSSGSKRASYIGKSDTTDQYGWEPEIDRAYNNGTNTTPTGKTFTSQWSVAAMALDLDNGTWEMFIDGVPTGTIYSGISGTYTFAIGDTMGSGYHTHTANFGQKPFKFPPPAGFQPLNAANIRPETVIVRPDQYVGIVTYTGDGNSPRKISGYNFAPDLIWYKQRNSARDNQLYDTVRGSGSNKNLSSNTTYSETANDDELYGYTSAFNDNGFTVTTGSSNFNYANASSSTYVAWAWKAGGNKNTFNVDDVGYASAAAAGITEGTISLTGASIGTKQGFSIIKYTGNSAASASIGHGLTQAPKFIICKNIGITKDWVVYTETVGPGNTLYLNEVDVAGGGTGTWGNVSPTSTVFSVGSNSTTNYSGPMIAYCWHDVPGLQKFGSYTGNNDADGPFIELGFKPSVLMVKRTAGANANWYIMDKETQKINPVVEALEPNTSDSTNTASVVNFDFLSNGFKVRGTDGDINATNIFIYAAWAEAPAFNLYGAQSNAR